MDIWKRQQAMFTLEEQKKIEKLTVMIAGAGGLGTHQVVELQRIGVKKIYLVDYDMIESSNLNRQILYGSEDVGKAKVEKAEKLLSSFELETEIVPIKKKIGKEFNCPADVDLVFDALDNFTARYKLEEAANRKEVPLIYAAVRSWFGQITTIISGKTPSLAEIFGENPGSKENIPAFSPVVSVIASLQVIEGVKVILNKENNLINRLMLLDLDNYSINLIDF